MENTSTDTPTPAPPKGEWNGAAHIRNTQLIDNTGKYATSFAGVKSAVAEVITDPIHRDIGHCMPFLMKESLQAASQLLYKEDEEALELLDCVGQLIAKVWNDSVADNLQGIAYFNQMYEEIRSHARGEEIYSAFCSFFVQSYFCYLFTVPRMAIGIRPLEERDSEFQGMATVLAGLSPELRREVIKEWTSEGFWPTTVNAAPLLRRLDDYIEVIKEGQALRKQHSENREQ